MTHVPCSVKLRTKKPAHYFSALEYISDECSKTYVNITTEKQSVVHEVVTVKTKCSFGSNLSTKFLLLLNTSQTSLEFMFH